MKKNRDVISSDPYLCEDNDLNDKLKDIAVAEGRSVVEQAVIFLREGVSTYKSGSYSNISKN